MTAYDTLCEPTEEEYAQFLDSRQEYEPDDPTFITCDTCKQSVWDGCVEIRYVSDDPQDAPVVTCERCVEKRDGVKKAEQTEYYANPENAKDDPFFFD